MEIDKEQCWNHETYPYELVNEPYPLGSDGNLRSDVLFWKLKDFDNAQKWKEVLEVLQRGDRKMREKLGDKKH